MSRALRRRMEVLLRRSRRYWWNVGQKKDMRNYGSTLGEIRECVKGKLATVVEFEVW